MVGDENPPLRPLPTRDRVYVVTELFAVTSLAWLYLVRMPMAPADFGGLVARLAAPIPQPMVDLGLTFMMWAVMMVAMMLPTAAPMILLYARIARGRPAASPSWVRTFAAGYLAVWTAFSAAATITQALLLRASIISGALSVAPAIGGTILVVTGFYQLSPLKMACLRRCQSPLAFFMTRWRDGAAGAFRMGVQHGAFCVGCCWLLMALLFVAGVMNLAWVAVITAFVLVEKLLPYPRAISFGGGLALIACGLAMMLQASPGARTSL
jgi:predicted metal-binding membrane protein